MEMRQRKRRTEKETGRDRQKKRQRQKDTERDRRVADQGYLAVRIRIQSKL